MCRRRSADVGAQFREGFCRVVGSDRQPAARVCKLVSYDPHEGNRLGLAVRTGNLDVGSEHCCPVGEAANRSIAGVLDLDRDDLAEFRPRRLCRQAFGKVLGGGSSRSITRFGFFT